MKHPLVDTSTKGTTPYSERFFTVPKNDFSWNSTSVVWTYCYSGHVQKSQDCLLYRGFTVVLWIIAIKQWSRTSNPIIFQNICLYTVNWERNFLKIPSSSYRNDNSTPSLSLWTFSCIPSLFLGTFRLIPERLFRYSPFPTIFTDLVMSKNKGTPLCIYQSDSNRVIWQLLVPRRSLLLSTITKERVSMKMLYWVLSNDYNISHFLYARRFHL